MIWLLLIVLFVALVFGPGWGLVLAIILFAISITG